MEPEQKEVCSQTEFSGNAQKLHLTLTTWLPKEDPNNVNVNRHSNESKGNPTVFHPEKKGLDLFSWTFVKKKVGELKERENTKQKNH